MAGTDERRYRLNITQSVIEQSLDNMWKDVVAELQAAGVPAADIPAKREDAVTVTQERAGVGWVEVVVAFAPAINVVFETLWNRFVVPRLKKEHGRDALEEADDSDADE